MTFFYLLCWSLKCSRKLTHPEMPTYNSFAAGPSVRTAAHHTLAALPTGSAVTLCFLTPRGLLTEAVKTCSRSPGVRAANHGDIRIKTN